MYKAEKLSICIFPCHTDNSVTSTLIKIGLARNDSYVF